MPPKATNAISRTVDPNLSITTAEQSMELDKAFDDAFGPLHELTPPPKETPKASAPPEVEEPPLIETEEPPLPPDEDKTVVTTDKKTPPADKTELVADKTAPAADIAPPHPDDEIQDEELDNLRLHPDSRPETVETFKKLRGMVKTEHKLSKELRERVEKQDKELTGLRSSVRPVSDPQVQSELEDLRQFRVRHQVFDDAGYQNTFEQPVRVIFDDIISDIKKLSPDQGAADDWEKQLRSVGPDRLGREYWNQGVVEQCQDPLHKERLVRKINLLLEAQDRRNEFREHMANQPEAYEQFRQQQAQEYWRNFSLEAEDEANKLVPTMGEWATPKDVAMAKTATERTAFETHNKAYQQYEDLFKQFLTDVATNGPRGMTRIAVRAVMAERYKRELDTASTRLAKLQAELKAAQDELTKIAGARSRVAQGSSGTSTGSAPTPRQRLGKSVDDAFKEHFGT